MRMAELPINSTVEMFNDLPTNISWPKDEVERKWIGKTPFNYPNR